MSVTSRGARAQSRPKERALSNTPRASCRVPVESFRVESLVARCTHVTLCLMHSAGVPVTGLAGYGWGSPRHATLWLRMRRDVRLHGIEWCHARCPAWRSAARTAARRHDLPGAHTAATRPDRGHQGRGGEGGSGGQPAFRNHLEVRRRRRRLIGGERSGADKERRMYARAVGAGRGGACSAAPCRVPSG